jgi:undecaprenyl-diphosphatase
MEFLYAIDKAVFIFINQTLGNPIGDVLWPLITDYDKLLPVRIVLGGVVLALLIWGGKNGRIAVLLVALVITAGDQLSSSVIKKMVDRPRPCHVVDGHVQVENIRQLVHCGPGKSFPSSHAVNNFAVAAVFSFFYRKWLWAFATWASLVALSRPAVGVHYPSDILGGAIIGLGVAAVLLLLWVQIDTKLMARRAAGTQGRSP